MKKVILLFVLFFMGLTSCNQEGQTIEEKKAAIKAKEDQVSRLQREIDSLKKQLAAVDSTYNISNGEKTLITTEPVTKKTFEHFIEVSGSVESRQNVSLSAETSGTVTNIFVEEGDYIRKGSVVMKLDDETLTNNIEELKTSLDLATTVYKRRKNLWDRNIGTEIQYLEAKNKMESLQRQLATARSRLEKTRVKAPFSGNVDKLMIKEGEMAQPGVPLLRLVNLNKMYIEGDVSEAHIGSFEAGDTVNVKFPSLDLHFTSKISSIGQVINPANRTFRIEVKIPQKYKHVKPNLLAVLTMRDFKQNNALVIPTDLIQQDNEGNYVYTINTNGNQKNAVKKHIERGRSYNNETVVKSGLSPGDLLIDEGFREVSDGTLVKEAKVSYNF